MTILGSQNSNKSILFNYLFGLDYKTSSNRHTKGVYGTYYNISNSAILNCESVFLLDVEGLFFTNNNKDDLKLILFCLAVSDFVIINTNSNLDSQIINKL